jgi:ferredoxin--NADP+ reductase
VEAHAAEIWQLVQDPMTHVYLAGMEKIVARFDATMARAAGSAEAWQAAKQQLMDEKRWSQLIYQ